MNFYFGNKKELEKGEQTGENIASQVPASVVAQVPEVNAHQMGENNGSKGESSQLSKQTDAKTLSTLLSRDDVTRAEIIWALHVSYHHLSYRCCEDLSPTFQQMFTDSEIAKKFSLGKTKVSYVIVRDLAPYLHDHIAKVLNDCNYFVACFDEALNHVVQRGQMDVHIRFWHETQRKVATRYFTSAFLGHARTTDLLEKFKGVFKEKSLSKFTQVSMDGPSVNWKFIDGLSNDAFGSDESELLEYGLCGLHVVHGAFQTGHNAVNWNVNSTPRAFYRILKDSPARRADYSSLTGSTLFPLKFCSTRWVENASVAQRALEIYPIYGAICQNSKVDKNRYKCSSEKSCF